LRYQTLQLDPANPIARPYFLEPQLNVLAFRPNLMKMDFSMIGQYSRFTHVDAGKVQGNRFVLYPSCRCPSSILPSRSPRRVAHEPVFLKTRQSASQTASVVFCRPSLWIRR
jgi:hypothetical protein